MKTILLMIFVSCLSLQNSFAQWTSDTSGIGYISQRSLVVSGNKIFAGTTNNGVFLSTNDGTSWSQTTLNNQFIFSLAASGSNVYAGTNGNGIFVSTNTGATWSQSLMNQYVVSLAVLGNYIFAGVYYNGVYVSTNNGTTWTQTTLNTGDVYSLAISGSNIIAGKYLNGIYISSNNGSTWTQTSLNNQTIQSLFVIGNDIYAGTYYSAGIYKSTDNGATWSPGTLLNRSVYSFATIGGTIVAGSDGYGVYISSDNGGTWIQRNEGFAGSPRVYGLCVLNNYIFAGTDYSVYRRETNQLNGIKQISAEVPVDFNLSQNYPNPFNPVTNIQFSIPKAGNVKIVVFDALGREAVTLVNGKYSAGKYNVDFDASMLPSGVYFYRLEAGSYYEVKKMLLVK
ncbi:MAG: T9SS type A sorting domain-containing protein [Ignavibacteria bacterium]